MDTVYGKKIGRIFMPLTAGVFLLILFLAGCAENELKKCEYSRGQNDGNQNSGREEKLCLLNYAVTFRDITGCDRIRAMDQKEMSFTISNDCYAFIAKYNKDESLCSKIKGDRGGTRKSECIKAVEAAKILRG